MLKIIVFLIIFFSLWQWRAKSSVQTLSSSAGKLDVNKSDGLPPWLAQTKGLKGQNVAKKDQNLEIYFSSFFFASMWMDWFITYTYCLWNFYYSFIHPSYHSSILTMTHSFIHSLFLWILNKASHSILDKIKNLALCLHFQSQNCNLHCAKNWNSSGLTARCCLT